MKTALLLQARYNQFANKNMFATLQGAPKDALYKDCGLYYGSIMQTAEHSFAAQLALCSSTLAHLPQKSLRG